MGSCNDALDGTPFSVFEDLERRIRAAGHDRPHRLHQGKTTFQPAASLAEWPAGAFELEAHHHASPAGIAGLTRRIAEVETGRLGRTVTAGDVLVTCGASHAIHLVLAAVTRPGDEVIILSPQWLFAVGLVRAANAVPVEVPVFVDLAADASFDFLSRVETAIGPRTRAIYFNTPNNPTGYSMTPAQLSGLAALAEAHDLWLISDDAYENYDFSDHGFTEISTLDRAVDRTFQVHSFSKSYIMPGYRVGYLVCPPGMADRLRKYGLYSVYSIATASQYGAFQALNEDPARLARRHADVRRVRDITLDLLAVPHTGIMGGFYTFLDLGGETAADTDAFIDRCIARGVTLAPGTAFGTGFDRYARLCFTAVTEADLPAALETINQVHAALQGRSLRPQRSAVA